VFNINFGENTALNEFDDALGVDLVSIISEDLDKHADLTYLALLILKLKWNYCSSFYQFEIPVSIHLVAYFHGFVFVFFVLLLLLVLIANFHLNNTDITLLV
jgi:hypothetical protein